MIFFNLFYPTGIIAFIIASSFKVSLDTCVQRQIQFTFIQFFTNKVMHPPILSDPLISLNDPLESYTGRCILKDF